MREGNPVVIVGGASVSAITLPSVFVLGSSLIRLRLLLPREESRGGRTQVHRPQIIEGQVEFGEGRGSFEEKPHRVPRDFGPNQNEGTQSGQQREPERVLNARNRQSRVQVIEAQVEERHGGRVLENLGNLQLQQYQ